LDIAIYGPTRPRATPCATLVMRTRNERCRVTLLGHLGVAHEGRDHRRSRLKYFSVSERGLRFWLNPPSPGAITVARHSRVYSRRTCAVLHLAAEREIVFWFQSLNEVSFACHKTIDRDGVSTRPADQRTPPPNPAIRPRRWDQGQLQCRN
jgi:hypothetical protein